MIEKETVSVHPFETFQDRDKSQLASVTPFSYQKLATELLRYCRGEMNQRSLSQKLGYSFNQVGKWESGVTQIKWSDFLSVCDVMSIPIYKHIQIFFWPIDGDNTPYNALVAINKSIQLSTSTIREKADLMKKWIVKKVEPDFAEVLRAIDTRDTMMVGWISQFADCSNIESIRLPYEQFMRALDAIVQDPVAMFVDPALRLKQYEDMSAHNEEFLMEHAACTREQLRHSLASLVEAGIVFYDGKKYYPSTFEYFNFTTSLHPKIRALAKRTTDLASQKFTAQPMPIPEGKRYNLSRYSARVTPMSEKTAALICEAMSEFQSKITELVANDHDPKTNVQIILVHSFASNLNAPPLGEQK